MTDETEDKRHIARIGNSEKQGKPSLKYANPKGECSRFSCNGLLKRRPEGNYFGKYCDKCTSLLNQHGDFETKVPTLKHKQFKVIYDSISETIRDMLKEENPELLGAAGAIQRAIEKAGYHSMGDPVLAQRNDVWLYHHYLHNELVNKKRHFAELTVHLMAVVGTSQLLEDKFASSDQRDLFIVRRAFRRGLPRVNGAQKAHGHWPLRRARMIAKKLKGDYKLGSEAISRAMTAFEIKADRRKRKQGVERKVA